jgi:hypothetical protein
MEALERHLGVHVVPENNAVTEAGTPCSEDDDDGDVMNDSTEEASTEVVKPPPSMVRPTLLPPPMAPIASQQSTATGGAMTGTGDAASAASAEATTLKSVISESKETLTDPTYEEDLVDGFSFVAFKTYEDLEVG